MAASICAWKLRVPVELGAGVEFGVTVKRLSSGQREELLPFLTELQAAAAEGRAEELIPRVEEHLASMVVGVDGLEVELAEGEEPMRPATLDELRAALDAAEPGCWPVVIGEVWSAALKEQWLPLPFLRRSPSGPDTSTGEASSPPSSPTAPTAPSPEPATPPEPTEATDAP